MAISTRSPLLRSAFGGLGSAAASLSRAPLRSACLVQIRRLSVHAELGLPPHSPHDAVKTAYLQKIKTLHPDQGGSVGMFLRLQRAWEEHSKAAARRPAAAAAGSADYAEMVCVEVAAEEAAAEGGGVDWTDQRVELMSSSVVRAVGALPECDGFDAPILHRLRVGEAGLAMQLAARDPNHREAVSKAIGRDAGRGFLAQLQQVFVAAGGPMLTLTLEGPVRWHTSGGGARGHPQVVR